MKKLLLLLTLIFTIANITPLQAATTPTQENVTKLYVATFKRAPLQAGLNYWVNDSGLKLEGIAMSFFDQKETKAKYPEGSSIDDFIVAVFANLFNREPAPAGLKYWGDELRSGKIHKSTFILAVINGALGNDAVILSNKTEVAMVFATLLGTSARIDNDDPDDPVYLASIKILAEITEDRVKAVEVLGFLESIEGSEDPVSDILNGKKSNIAILSLVTQLRDANLTGVLSANQKSKLRFMGLEDSSIKLKVTTTRDSQIILPASISIETQSITFTSPVNVTAGNLSVVDILGNVLTAIPYKIVTAQTPYLKEVVPDIVNAGESVTLSGGNLPITPMQVVFEGQESSLAQTVTPLSSSSMSFTVPPSAASGSIYLQINQVETNRLQLTIKRSIDVKVVLGDGVDFNASDISFTLGMEEHILDQNYIATLSVENEDMQYLHATVPFTDENAALLYSAVVLPDMSGTVTVDANSTAVAWIFMGMGTSVTTPKDELRPLYDSVASNAEVVEFAEYIVRLQKDDFNAWATLSDEVLRTKFQDALRSVVGTSVESRARMLSAKAAEDNALVKITQPENGNIYLENRKSDGNIWIVNDTRLYLSVEVVSKEEGKEYYIDYKHPGSLEDMQFVNGIVGPKGWVWLGIASDKKFELRGIDSSLEIIVGAYNGETDKEKVSTILKARAFLEGIIAPATDMILSTLLKKGVPEDNAWKHVIDGMYDIYGTNFVTQLQTEVSTQSNGWWATADTLVMMPLARGIKGCLKEDEATGIRYPDTACKNTIKGLLKISGIAIYSYEKVYDEVMKRIKEEIKEQVIKSAIALIPVGGWIARSAIFVWENSSEVGKVITMGETISDMKENPPEINAEVEFALDISEVAPMCVVIPSDIGSQSYSFAITGEGFVVEDGINPYVKLLSKGMDIQTDDVTVTNEGTQILALFPEPLNFIANGSQEDAALFVGYSDGLYMMYPESIRVIDQTDDVVYFDSIVPAAAYRGATVTLKGCGWVPTSDIKVYFEDEGSDGYIEGEVLKPRSVDTIIVKVPKTAKSGNVYVTAGNKVTEKLLFDINPFSLNEVNEEYTMLKGDTVWLTGKALTLASKIYLTDHTGKMIEGDITESDESSLKVAIPEGLAYGEIQVYAEDEEGAVTNEIVIPLVPKGVDANPPSQSFLDSITVSLTQEDNVDIFYHIDEEEEEQRYTGPITLNADEAAFEYYSIHTIASVTVNGIDYNSTLEYQYAPIVCKVDEELIDGVCVNIFDDVHCPMIYDPLLDDDLENNNSILFLVRDKDGDGRHEDLLSCFYTPLWEGELTSENPIVDGGTHGIFKHYYRSGLVERKTPYVKSKRNGIEKRYRTSGRLWIETPYVDNTIHGIEKLYYDSEQPPLKLRSETPYVDGIIDGIEKWYYQSGRCSSETPYINGVRHGTGKGYYDLDSHQLSTEIPYIGGMYHGVFKRFYESGNLKEETPYINNIRHGIQKLYYEPGGPQHLHIVTPYDNGKIHGTQKWYYESGQLSHETPYVNGIQNGIDKGYYETGTPMSETPYVDGMKHGECKSYMQTGRMHICWIYDMGTNIGSCMPD